MIPQPQPGLPSGDDRGDADPLVRAALAASGDHLGYLRAIVALCTARLLMPLVVVRDDGGAPAETGRRAELAAVSIQIDAGERALLAFTGLDALLAWRADARPVMCTIDGLAATAGEAGSEALLIDAAGPFPLLIGADLVNHFEQGRRLVELPDGGFGWMFLDPDPATSVHQG